MDEMELRSRFDLRQRAVRRRRAQRGPSERDGGGGEDRLSALPDALLLLVLARLGSTAEAARTSFLSSRFDTCWPDLPVLVFHGVDADTLAHLLARARHGELDRLEIQLRWPNRGGLPSSRISSLLRAAAEHRPEELVFSVAGWDDGGVPFELPYFTRAKTIDLQISSRSFSLPPAGDFAKLESLTISRCRVDPAEFLPHCPCLRVLDVECYWSQHAVDVHSGSLQKLVLNDLPLPVADNTPRRVDIAAPMLKEFRMVSYGYAEMIPSFSAPATMVDTLSFRYVSKQSRCIALAMESRLKSLTTEMEWHIRYGQVVPVRERVLSLVILTNLDDDSDANRSFAEELLRLPVNNFSVLKLDLRIRFHDFGTLVFDLLKTMNAIRKLVVDLLLPLDRAIWTPKRYYDYDPDEWRNEDILLPYLEEIEIEGLNVTEHDIDFLEDLFSLAPELKVVRIELAFWVSQSDSGYKNLRHIFWKNSSVKFYVDGTLEEAPRRSPRLRAMRRHQA